MSGGTINNIPRRSRIIGNLLGGAVVDGALPLVEMLVSLDHEIDAVLEEEGLEGLLARDAFVSGDVPGSVAACGDPGCLFAVDGGEVFF